MRIGGFESCIRLMTIEEFLTENDNTIAISCDGNKGQEYVKNLLRKAWEEGYKFRITEEVTNKGASY